MRTKAILQKFRFSQFGFDRIRPNLCVELKDSVSTRSDCQELVNVPLKKKRLSNLGKTLKVPPLLFSYEGSNHVVYEPLSKNRLPFRTTQM